MERRFGEKDQGVWLDGAYGWHNSYRVVDLAVSHGMDLDETSRHAVEMYRHDQGSRWGEIMGEISMDATDYLQSLCDSGFAFVWNAGELSLMSDSEAWGEDW